MNTDKLKEKQTLDGILDAHIDFNESDYILINPKSELKDDLEVFIKQQVQLGRDEVIEQVLEILDQNDFCKCDPLSSGEEYCNNGCVVRYSINQLKEQK